MFSKRTWLGRAVCAAVVCVSIISAAFADIKTDLWDVNQGCELTGGCTWGAYPGSDIRNMFGGEFGTIEVGNAIYYDAQIFSPGATAWVSWKTPTAVDLGRFVLSVAADGNYPTSYNRAIQGFNLYASDIAHPYDDNWGDPIYASGLLPTPLGTYSNGIYNYTIDHTFSSPVSAQHFKADFIYGSFVTGPRIIELDGYPVPEPASLSLLALGGLALARKRK
jgi:hypothetical protein